MYDKVIITGSVGVGKTTIAKKLGEKTGLKVIDVTQFVKDNHLYTDKEDGEYIVKMASLKNELRKIHHAIMESHLLCEFKLSEAIVIVLRCDPHIVKNRLMERGYNDQKIKDNLETEALDYCAINATENYGNARVYELDVSKT